MYGTISICVTMETFSYFSSLQIQKVGSPFTAFLIITQREILGEWASEPGTVEIYEEKMFHLQLVF